jgi:hypothetical protein
MERVAITGLIIILVLTLVWFRRGEKYTEEQSKSLFLPFSGRYRGVIRDNFNKYTIKSILNVDIGDDPLAGLSNVNLLVDTLNSNGFTFSHFSNISELNTMFDTAYSSGESGLATRERMILRSFASPCINITLQFSKAAPYSYTNEGVPDFTSTIITESGKTTKEMLQYCFTILDKLFSAGGANPYTPEMIDYINSTIPSKYTQKFDRTDNMSVSNAITSPTPNETALWFIKAILIGPAYIAWIAENKWRLDITWRP